jgi:hypothetical protein
LEKTNFYYKRADKILAKIKKISADPGSRAVSVVGLQVRVPPVVYMSLVSDVFLDGGLCDKPITCPEESYRMRGV